jgi:type IV pilus assembly protein PilE
MYLTKSARSQRGFTLIELIVAMVIAAILAAIAIPAYSNYVRKAKRVDAKNALLDLASLEERYFSTTQQYSSSFSDLGYGSSTASTVTLPTGDFSIAQPTVTAATAPTASAAGAAATYSITATQVSGSDQTKDTTCYSFTVNSDGTQTSKTSTLTDSTSTCWK